MNTHYHIRYTPVFQGARTVERIVDLKGAIAVMEAHDEGETILHWVRPTKKPITERVPFEEELGA